MVDEREFILIEDDELLEEDVEISDELIDQLVEEIMLEGGKVQQAKELSDDDEAGDDDIKVKSVSKVVIVKDYYDDVEKKELKVPTERVAIWNGTGFTFSS